MLLRVNTYVFINNNLILPKLLQQKVQRFFLDFNKSTKSVVSGFFINKGCVIQNPMTKRLNAIDSK